MGGLGTLLSGAAGLVGTVWAWLSGLPGPLAVTAKILASAGILTPTFLTLRGVLRWANRQRSIARARKAWGLPGAPQLDPRRPLRMWRLAKPSTIEFVIETLHYSWLSVRGLATAREVIEQPQLKAENAAALTANVALMDAMDARGMVFLPPRVRSPLAVRLAIEQLRRSKAAPEAIAQLEKRQVGQQASKFYSDLFSETILQQVDATPDIAAGRDYFSKYFQPLMISFAEDLFAASAGQNAEEQGEVLTKHLVHLSNRKLVALRVTQTAPIPDIDSIVDKLPEEVPTKGFKAQARREAERRNKQACRSVVIVSDHDSVARAQQIEHFIEKRIDNCSIDYNVWTPQLDDEHVGSCCFLWQQLN